MAPIVEQNRARLTHPGAERPRVDGPLGETIPPSGEAGPSDAATIRAIRGKGIVATITPHFAVAVIVGLATAFVARRPDPVSAGVGDEARRCNESVTQLRADFTQFKAEMSIAQFGNERRLNELLARIPAQGQSYQPMLDPLAPGVSRQLQGR